MNSSKIRDILPNRSWGGLKTLAGRVYGAKTAGFGEYEPDFWMTIRVTVLYGKKIPNPLP